MTGREKILAAFSPEGTPAFPAAVCYHSILLRDHWNEITRAPWWAQFDPTPETAARAMIDMIEGTGEDWFPAPLGARRETRERFAIEVTPAGVVRVDRATGERKPLARPPVGGDQYTAQHEKEPSARNVRTPEELDELMDRVLGWKRPALPVADAGETDLPRLLVNRFGAEKLPLASMSAPLWCCYSLWGFEGLMSGLTEFPDLIDHACRRFIEDAMRRIDLYAAAGVGAVWIEDAMTDMVSPADFRAHNLAHLRPLTEAVRARGMRSVHYFCGRCDDRWDLLLDTGADALSLEESKKTFEIDIEAVAERVNGRMTLLGNLDAVAVLENGTDEQLQAEVARQCRAGRRNRRRFIASLGSPVTPRTPLSRVRRYAELVRQTGP